MRGSTQYALVKLVAGIGLGAAAVTLVAALVNHGGDGGPPTPWVNGLLLAYFQVPALAAAIVLQHLLEVTVFRNLPLLGQRIALVLSICLLVPLAFAVVNSKVWLLEPMLRLGVAWATGTVAAVCLAAQLRFGRPVTRS